jgi:lipid-binding SYLF domain-containing protein
MKTRIRAAVALLALVIAGASVRQVSAQLDEGKRIQDATTVFLEIMDAPDSAIPKAILDKAEGIAVFPGLIKAAFIFGGQRGHGILSAKDPKTGTWSAPAFMTMTGGSWGAQIGGQSIDLVLVVMNRRGLQNLVRNQFKIGGEASATAGPVGRTAEASTDIGMRAQILSYSRSRGLFGGVAVNGSVIAGDTDSNERFYGKPVTTRQILFELPAEPQILVNAWRETLRKYAQVGSEN